MSNYPDRNSALWTDGRREGRRVPGATVVEDATTRPSVGQAQYDDAAIRAIGTLLEGGVRVSSCI